MFPKSYPCDVHTHTKHTQLSYWACSELGAISPTQAISPWPTFENGVTGNLSQFNLFSASQLDLQILPICSHHRKGRVAKFKKRFLEYNDDSVSPCLIMACNCWGLPPLPQLGFNLQTALPPKMLSDCNVTKCNLTQAPTYFTHLMRNILKLNFNHQIFDHSNLSDVIRSLKAIYLQFNFSLV